MEGIRKHASYANVMATIAVFLALGGGAIAAKALKKNSVGTKQLKGKAVTEAKLADGAATQPKIASGAVVKGKIGDAAVGNGKIEDNAVTSTKIADGAVGLAKAANSLHQKCRSGTIYVIGTCLDNVNRGGAGGATYIVAEQDCEASGGRMASAAELSSMVNGGLGSIPTPLYDWAFELSAAAEAMIITNIGAPGVGAAANLHDYRCAFNPDA
jgi:hypothetical protein